MIIDTHAHLDYPDYAPDFEDVLARAQTAGVERVVTIGTSVESSRCAVELAQRYPMIHAAIGVHPTTADEAAPGAVDALRGLASHGRVAAIGETGLDYHHLPEGGPEKVAAYKDTQARIFRAQLDLAVEAGLNVIVHQRDAWEDTLAILAFYTGRLRAVFHCFGGTPLQAQELASMGHLVSFTGIITFKNAAIVRETAAAVSADGFMVETDCPYLAPVPYRGKRCEPAHTREVAVAVAQTRGVTLDELSAVTTATAERFFRFNLA